MIILARAPLSESNFGSRISSKPVKNLTAQLLATNDYELLILAILAAQQSWATPIHNQQISEKRLEPRDRGS